MNSSAAQALAIPPTVLIVEDEFIIRAMLSETLRDAGYAVIEAINGDDAMIKMSETLPDLIITDVRMPGSLDGIALVSKVREINSNLPVIITSAHLTNTDYLSSEATHFLCKPYEYYTIVNLVKEKVGAGHFSVS